MNNTLRPDVISVIIPCYNCATHLPACLNALLNQTYDPEKLEIILINDGSSDSTGDIIDAYEKTFLAKKAAYHKVYQQNMGVGAAMNTGLKYISGEFMLWQDSDDYLEANALEKLHSYLKSHNELSFVRGEVNFRSEKNPEIILKTGRSLHQEPQYIGDMLTNRRVIYCLSGCFMGRSAVFFENNQGNDIYPSRAGQNYQLLIPFATAGLCGYLPEVVLNCLVRTDSLSHAKKSLLQQLKQKQEYVKIWRYTMERIKLPDDKKKKLLAKANKKFMKKIRHVKKKLFIHWLLGKVKDLSFMQLLKIVFKDETISI